MAEWAVAVVGHAAEIVQPFTTNSEIIRAAFAKVRKSPTFHLQHEIDRSILSDRTRRELNATGRYVAKNSRAAKENGRRGARRGRSRIGNNLNPPPSRVIS